MSVSPALSPPEGAVVLAPPNAAGTPAAATGADGAAARTGPLAIAIVVHGRFHAFDLAQALATAGHQVTLFTGYPARVVRRQATADVAVRTCWLHAALSRLLGRLGPRAVRQGEPLLHPAFGRWAARRLQARRWDLVHVWSGVAEEVLAACRARSTPALLLRGSTHIRWQRAVLDEEARRTGFTLDRPSDWMVAREEREYALAPAIRVLSRAALDSFVASGVPPGKLVLVPSGVPTEAFRPSPEVLEARRRRILTGQPLKVLCVGALSFRKGLWDLPAIVAGVPPARAAFRFVGTVTPEARAFLARRPLGGEVVGHRPQAELPAEYAGADLVILPTLEEGLPQVLAQAVAAGVPVVTTPAGGAELVEDGRTGWIVPPRAPGAFADRLRWADAHRPELAEVARHVSEVHRPRRWADAAAELAAWARRARS